ncbi:MAG: hypothetical protein KKF46_02840 [Nanoarchaeota archaeon]|nr:hypothetical protein [Nanoarchaeota archaeon]MBU1321269.1 hypothetical protein [Nanoarchaeota archaeon]MBU1597340.1 hypothetical protein [Nanoarchaeota archaeon]MBU2441463.1 hypothetical protein [Nanoarchaeota archaeon]
MVQNYLFVCQVNKFRSPYAAEWLKDYCAENKIDANVKSAGLESTHTIKLTQEHVDWADTLLVMEKYMKKAVANNFYVQKSKKIINLNIPDIFTWVRQTEAPYNPDVNPKKAVKILKKGFKKYKYRRKFNTDFLHKVLEGKLERIIKK